MARWHGVVLGAVVGMVVGMVGPAPAQADEEPHDPPVVTRRAVSETQGLAERLLAAPHHEVEGIARALTSMTLPEMREMLRELRRIARLRDAPDVVTATRTPGLDARPQPLLPPDGTSIVHLETRLLEVPVDELEGLVGGSLPTKGTSARFMGAKAVAALLYRIERSATAHVLSAPRLAAADGQRADISVLSQVSYVQDYEVKTHGASTIGDPIVGVIQEGIQLDLVPTVSRDAKAVTVDVRCTFSELARPIKTMEIELRAPELEEVSQVAEERVPLRAKIQIPEVTSQELGAHVTLPPGGSVLLGGDAPVERDGVLVVRLVLLSATGIERMGPQLGEGIGGVR